MDPFTQRMLERARARQEKIDQKLANTGQSVPKRKPLVENNSSGSPTKTPAKTSRTSISSPKKPITESPKSNTPAKTSSRRSSVQKSDQIIPSSPQRARNDVIVTKKEFKSPNKGSLIRRNSDVSVEINISHRNDIQIEVQVEERDAPISVVYDSQACRGNNVTIKEIEDTNRDEDASAMEKEVECEKSDRANLRHNFKSRLDRLGNLYSDNPHLSSPIHRTELDFTCDTPPREKEALQIHEVKEEPQQGKKKFGRLAALADQINNWEDDLTHHNFHQEPVKKKPWTKPEMKKDKMDSSTLDVSIHSLNDINKVLQTTASKTNTHTFKKPMNECQRLEKQIVAELEGEGYRRVSASQSRLVYDFNAPKRADPDRQEPKCASTTPSAAPAPNMATMVATGPVAPVTKKPSIKKYKAPTPPSKTVSDDDCDSDKDKENNVQQREHNENDTRDCKQTKPEIAEKPAIDKGSPVVKRLAPKLNGNVDRNSVLSKAAMFEAGSPKAKDPAEMSLRERKALFEKNKGTAIIPKAPFGLAPSTKTLHGDNKASAKPIVQQKTPTKSNNSTPSRSNSKEEIPDDNISQTSLGGIKGKLAALFSKEQTISESTIANKFKQEREKEMEMLQNRFHYKPQQPKPEQNNDSDDDQSDSEPSDKAPLMRSTISLNNANKKPEIVANVPKVTFEKTKSETAVNEEEDKVIGSQPVKRRSSQDSPVVLAVVDDVKRIKVNNKEVPNGNSQARLYPHLSDIETDHTNSQEEYSDCGGSSTDEVPMKPCNDDLNKSDNWAETSFGREVMNVVKKNNSSYRKAVRESDSDESGACDSELDDMLDEALADDSEGPTPPKQNKAGAQKGLSSSSFVYQESKQFKSPLKSAPITPVTHRDKGNELVHSVSFYRRMQNASSTPSTPMRVIRHCSPEREAPPSEPEVNVTTVRQRIKELQNEISKQQTVISQASQALNLCAATIEFSGSTEQAEGERLLLLASHRRAACVQELQRLQVEGAGEAAARGAAQLHVHSLAVPLRRDYVRRLNADGAVGHHAVCLLKCRDRVLATSMQQTKPTSNVLHFPDEIQMLGITSDFKVTVEVYLLQASKEVLPHDVKYHISNKKGSSKLLTPKGKSSSLKTPCVQSPGGPLAVRSPQFALHGYCIFALPQAHRKTFTLNKVPAGSPLEGGVQLDMKARLAVAAPAPHAAFLTAFDDVSGLGAWHRRWFKLHPPTLAYWKYPDDVQKKMPIGDIDLSTVVSEKAIKAPRDLCARPHTILLETSVPAGLVIPDSGSLVYTKRGDNVVRRHLLAADTAADRDLWLEKINNALDTDEVPMKPCNDDLNKSDNWAETSFGREVMNVVKKNNSSYRKAVRESDSDESGACDSELDDMLDEALADDSEGPTPPKQNKAGAQKGLSSSSFVYQESKQFKSPLKSAPITPVTHRDKGNELVHSVSFYRRMQNASSTPSTPMRVIRHCSPEREAPPSEPEVNVTTVRQRIKELQNEISKQQTVISQASQALNLCAATIEFSGSTEQAEGERLLLLASHRRAACVQELQRLQVEGAGEAAARGAAQLHVHSLAVPLRRDYVRRLNADGAVGHHAVCLLKCRDRVLATSMQQTKPTSNVLHFPDEIQMLGITSDFKVTVEVYLLQASKEVLPHDVKYHISNKKGSSKLLTPKGKSSSLKTPCVQSPGGPLAVRSPQFALHGYCIFALPQAHRKTFTLNKVPAGSPLEGGVQLDMKARLAVAAPAPHAAFLTAFDDVSGLGAWHRRWFKLHPPTLAYWKYPDDVQKKMPIGDIDLSTVVSEKAIKAPRDLCARPHTILLETSVPAGLVIPDSGSLVYTKRGDNVVRRHLLAADTAADRDLWLEKINNALEYVRCCSTDDE